MSDDNVKDFRKLCNVLKVLVNLAKDSWGKSLDLNGKPIGKTARDTNDFIVDKTTWAEKGLKDEITKNWSTYRLCLKPFRLPPLKRKKDFVPLLKFKCDLNGSSRYLSLRVIMCRKVEEKTDEKIMERLKGLGIRFETADTTHNYCHVQLFSLSSREKVPEEDPCIPTEAGCPVSLLTCMIVSFYGMKTWTKYFTEIHLEQRHMSTMKQFFC